MRQLLCPECYTPRLPEGTRQILARSADGEPAEYQRLTVGRAKRPTREQRMIYVNNDPLPLEVDHYDCDDCGQKIERGELCAAWSVWTEDQAETEYWEPEFLEPK